MLFITSLGVPIVYLGGLHVRDGTRVIEEARFPASGMTSAFDRRVLRGTAAVRLGSVLRLLGALLIVLAVLVIVLSTYIVWRLFPS